MLCCPSKDSVDMLLVTFCRTSFDLLFSNNNAVCVSAFTLTMLYAALLLKVVGLTSSNVPD